MKCGVCSGRECVKRCNGVKQCVMESAEITSRGYDIAALRGAEI